MMGTEKESIFHDTIGMFERIQVFPKCGVSSDIPSECDTCLYIILLKKLDEFEAIGALQWDGEPIGGHRVVGECIIRTILKVIDVPLDVLTPLLEKPIQLIELYETEGGI